MCGIAGVVGLIREDLRQVVEGMTESLVHRGPDAEGYYFDVSRGVGLGHRRLSIIDLSERGTQPLWNENRSLCLLANGEIYNFKELRRELEARGHSFHSDTDVEVVVHGFEEWGEEVFCRLRGMYAVALYDTKSCELTLARDPLGIKPLYYVEENSFFAFASEAKAFHALPNSLWRFSVDDESLDLILRFQYLPDCRKTMIRGVSKLRPGHVLRWKEGKVELRRFWELRADPTISELTFEDTAKACEEKLKESVVWTLNADVPVGILLSGGLDSSLVAALAVHGSGQEVKTFTAAFDHELDESDAAELVARHLGTTHTAVFIDAGEVNDRMEEMISVYDDLTSFDGGVFTLCILAEKIREHGIKVLLFGDGADEVFSGYSWYGMCQRPFKWMPASVRNFCQFYAMTRMLPGWTKMRHIHFFNEVMANDNESDICRQIGRYEITTQLPNHFNMKTDKALSSRSLEARVPYLDHRLVEFAYSLPASHKIGGEWFSMRKVQEKRILREVAKRYLPTETVFRKKRGFLVPVAEILKSRKDRVTECLLRPDSFARRYFSVRSLEDMMRFRTVLYSPIEKQKEFLVWKFFLLQIWHDQALSRMSS